MLGKSILWRLGSDPNPPDENAYRGEYIKTLAEELRAQGGPVDLERAMRYGKDRLLEEIRKDLTEFRVRYDTWTSEEALHRSGKVDEILNYFTSQGLTYTKDQAIYLKTTDHGDVEDKPIVKSDGTFVYRLQDLAARSGPTKRPAWGAVRGSIMFDTLLAMGVGTGFFVLMYEWVTMIANTMP